MYRECVGLYGMQPDYFLDQCTIHEALIFLEGARKRGWEQTRMVAYTVAKMLGSNIDEPVDLMRFAWEEEEEETEEDIEALREKIKQIKL